MDYRNTALPPEKRAEDLLGKLTVEEKLAQLQCDYLERIGEQNFCSHALGSISCIVGSVLETKQETLDMICKAQRLVMANSRFGIPAIFHIETGTGVLLPDATQFPHQLARAASWNPELEQEVASVIGQQASSCGIRHGLAPVLDLSRDARMGRQGETYGEDGTLASAMGTAYVKGLQSQGIMACSKHFLGFMASQGGIHAAKTVATTRELREQYGKPFHAAIRDGDLRSVMNSYSAVDGTPVGGSKELLTDYLRGELGFDGFTISDYGSVGQLHTVHRLAESMSDAGLLALDAGMDVEAPFPESFNEELLHKFQSGEADMAILDRAVLRVLTEKFRLGLFENPFPQSSEEIQKAYTSENARQICHQSALEAPVLLKNDGLLPLNQEPKTIAVIGWHGGTIRNLFGCYMNFARQECRLGAVGTMAGIEGAAEAGGMKIADTYPGSAVLREHPDTDKLARACYPGTRSLAEELTAALTSCQVEYAYGYPFTGNDEAAFPEALALAENADVVIVTLGGRYGWTTGCTTGEGLDSVSIGLPQCQERFLEELEKLGKTVVGVHFDGRPISSDRADRVCNALVEAWTPGEWGNAALAELLIGKANFSGKLPVSIAYNGAQIPVYHSMERGSGFLQSESIGFHDYVDCSHKPRYAFGHGLSYTKFNLTDASTDKTVYGPDEAIRISCCITNSSAIAGSETVQLYVTDEYASMSRPGMELAGFKKVKLQPGEKKEITFTLQPEQLAFLDASMRWKIEKGEFTLKLGAASDRLLWQQTVKLTADRWIDGCQRSFVAKAEVY